MREKQRQKKGLIENNEGKEKNHIPMCMAAVSLLIKKISKLFNIPHDTSSTNTYIHTIPTPGATIE